ncbi:Signal transduction histidine kinase [Desulfotomaculum arcticum]|uniref:histidine kinase n=1 Tax=Desulfotruncus arcticus DSM 17038 TaxID=1121424 RepID=A0A1I2V8L1_9FIRM|nr:HAMP domain-containing sensor histidine kinase [Desulfotruncus arcticus]SFG84527.1 Signal transduction histidine kinase [Desulfotomaculum arcticum] [Desulfotruncus arcticus DSM 17038]
MKSIALKFWAGMMVLVVMVLLLLWFFQIVFLENFYTRMRISEIKKESIAIIELLNNGNKSAFADRLDALAFNNNLSVELLDSGGKNIYTAGSVGSSGHMPMMNNRTRSEAFYQALAGRQVAIPLTHPRFGNQFMMIGLPVMLSGETSGVLIISMPLAPVEDTASILKWQLFYITIILLAAALLISYLITRSLTRPILEIKKVAETMASGDFSARVKTQKQDEIGKLAATINYLGQQLSKIEQFRKDLIANVSHELRTPLSLIRGYAETIRDVTGNTPGKREKHIGIIIEETERLSSIVDDILNLSQLQAGYFELNISRFPVGETIDDVVKRFNLLSESTGVRIVRQGTGAAPVEADEARIGQVLFNLINNGFNHTPPGGAITVKMTDAPHSVRIEVADTGSGIPEEDLPQIWDRFYKADQTGRKRAMGTGLGLAIVKSVLEAHQAAYGVESQKNVGTTFWFELKK